MTERARRASLSRRADALAEFHDWVAGNYDMCFPGGLKNEMRLRDEINRLRTGDGVPGPTLAEIKKCCRFRKKERAGNAVLWWAGTESRRYLALVDGAPAWTTNIDHRWLWTTPYEAAEAAVAAYDGERITVLWTMTLGARPLICATRGPIAQSAVGEWFRSKG